MTFILLIPAGGFTVIIGLLINSNDSHDLSKSQKR